MASKSEDVGTITDMAGLGALGALPVALAAYGMSRFPNPKKPVP